eukprot:TRINITY_DN54942_c0_g1_i3.p1 TRINITY_DN54942_c0_g1~~TRINITY_DN54942_c0_g1_i3.p1  ORF type:complete len:226 (+),score=51.27 TRINITY_DN54942_c0_g1_i3:220-897(+)
MHRADGYMPLGDDGTTQRDAPPTSRRAMRSRRRGTGRLRPSWQTLLTGLDLGGREDVVLEEDDTAMEESPKSPVERRLPTESLEEIPWSSFLQRLCWVIKNDRDAVRDSPETFDELRAVQILMLHANFFIALHQPRVVGGDTFPARTQRPAPNKVTYIRSIVASGSLKLLDENLLEHIICLLYTSDAADEEDSVDLGGRRIIKKKKKKKIRKEGHLRDRQIQSSA